MHVKHYVFTYGSTKSYFNVGLFPFSLTRDTIVILSPFYVFGVCALVDCQIGGSLLGILNLL